MTAFSFAGLGAAARGVDSAETTELSSMNLSYAIRRNKRRLIGMLPGQRAQFRREAMVGPLGFWNELQSYQLRALRENGLLPGHHLLDLGCGPLQGGIAFIRYLDPGRYCGLDHYPAALNDGYRQIGEQGLAVKNPRLVHSERFDPPALLGARFDYIWASQILYYFNGAKLAEMFGAITPLLAPGGKFLGDILGECEPEFRTKRHLDWIAQVQPHTVESLDAAARPFGLRARSVGAIKNYGYPLQLNLRSNVLIEFSASGAK